MGFDDPNAFAAMGPPPPPPPTLGQFLAKSPVFDPAGVAFPTYAESDDPHAADLMDAIFGHPHIPILNRLRLLSHTLQVGSPVAVLAVALVQAACDQPETLISSPVSGMPTPINLCVGLAGHSGCGKSTTIELNLHPYTPTAWPGGGTAPFIKRPNSPDYLIDSFFEQPLDDKGHKDGDKVLHGHPIIDVASELEARMGKDTSLGRQLAGAKRQLFSGEAAGTGSLTKLKDGTGHELPAREYRYCSLEGIPDGAAHLVVDDSGSGDIQRLLVVDAASPRAMTIAELDAARNALAHLDTTYDRDYRSNAMGDLVAYRRSAGLPPLGPDAPKPGVYQDYPGYPLATLVHGPARVTLSPQVQQIIRENRELTRTRSGGTHKWDTHRDSILLRIGSVLAGWRYPPFSEVTLTEWDWGWAVALWEHNRRAKAQLLKIVEGLEDEEATRKGRTDSVRRISQQQRTARYLDEVVDRLDEKIRANPGLPYSDYTKRLSGKGAGVRHEAMARAIADGLWVVHDRRVYPADPKLRSVDDEEEAS